MTQVVETMAEHSAQAEEPSAEGAARRREEYVIRGLNEQFGRTRRLLAGEVDEVAESVLSRFGDHAAERRIAAALDMAEPIADAERFPEVHRRALRALEVLALEGSRDPDVPNLGPLGPFVENGVETVTGFITGSYSASVRSRLRQLYAYREALCPPGSPQRRMVARARVEVDRIATETGGTGGLVTLLVGGALVPVVGALFGHFGVLESLINAWVLLGIFLVLTLMFLGSAWMLLKGAATAHHRSRLIMQEPLTELWETVGYAGDVPQDSSVTFATVAILLTALAWFVLPLLAVISFVLDERGV